MTTSAKGFWATIKRRAQTLMESAIVWVCPCKLQKYSEGRPMLGIEEVVLKGKIGG